MLTTTEPLKRDMIMPYIVCVLRKQTDVNTNCTSFGNALFRSPIALFQFFNVTYKLLHDRELLLINTWTI